jgi:hypothetical protein
MQVPTIALPRIPWRSGSMAAVLLLALGTCSPSPADQANQLAAAPVDDPIPTAAPAPAAAPADDAPDAEPRPPVDATVEPQPEEDPGTDRLEEDIEPPPMPDGPQPQRVVTPSPLADEVDLREADLLVRNEGGGLPTSTSDLEGATDVAVVRELTAAVTNVEDEEHELEVLAVDPVSFRPFTPDVTAQSRAVWERLDDGDVLVRHDVAHELGLELGETIRLQGDAGSTSVRIGALAANGAPPFADLVVPFEVAANLGSPGVNAVLVAAEDDPEALVDGLEEFGEVELRRPPEPEQSTSRPTDSAVELEPFTYTSRGDGTIAIHGDWVQRNIVQVDIPGMGTTRCHRAMVPQLHAALQQIADEGLYDHFKPEQFGGCWVPRHIMWSPDRGLSMHAWGLAIDFNVQDNWYGEEPQMHPRIVEIFERWGFRWGGHWSTPDGMHFEVERFVQVD